MFMSYQVWFCVEQSVGNSAAPQAGLMRRGTKKAVGAAAASILTAAGHSIATGAFYQALGAGCFDNRAQPNQIERLVAKIQSIGYDADIKPLAARLAAPSFFRPRF